MKIWLVNHYLCLNSQRGTLRQTLLAKELAKRGHNVRLVGCDKNHYRNRTNVGPLRLWETRRIQENLNVVWINSVPYSANGVFRFVNMIVFSVLFFLYSVCAIRSRPDLIVASSGHIFTAFAAGFYSWLSKTKFVFEIRDLWPLTLIEMGWIREGGRVASIMYGMEKWIANHADAVVGTIPGISEYFHERGLCTARVEWIPNGVILEHFQELKQSRIADEFIVCYFGSIGKPNAVDILLRTAIELHKRGLGESIRFVIIGEGTEKERLVKTAEGLGLTNFAIEDQVPRGDLRKKVSDADAFVTAVKNRPRLYRYGLSMNKLSEYMALGRPVVMAGNPPQNPIQVSGGGIVVEYDDVNGLADAITDLVGMSPEKRRNMGSRGRAFAENFLDYERVINKYADLIEETVRA